VLVLNGYLISLDRPPHPEPSPFAPLIDSGDEEANNEHYEIHRDKEGQHEAREEDEGQGNNQESIQDLLALL